MLENKLNSIKHTKYDFNNIQSNFLMHQLCVLAIQNSKPIFNVLYLILKYQKHDTQNLANNVSKFCEIKKILLKTQKKIEENALKLSIKPMFNEWKILFFQQKVMFFFCVREGGKMYKYNNLKS